MAGKKTTLAAIAREAHVGIATVDRVINQRATVRPETARRVIAAAHKLGFALEKSHQLFETVGQPAARIKMGFILLRKEHSFYAQLADSLLEQAAPYYDAEHPPQFMFHDISAVSDTAAAITQLSQSVDVIGVLALDNPMIRFAVEEATRQGIKVFTLLSDLSVHSRAGYIGWAVDRLCHRQGDVGVIIGDNRFLCQETCEISFRSYLREHLSGQRVLEPVRSHERAESARQVTQTLLEQHPNLVALYAPCGGVEGIIAALRKSGRQHQVMLICHGPVAGGEMALIDGTLDLMLRHRIAEFAASVISTFVAATGGGSSGFSHTINRFDLITKENL
ncbi:lac repressor [Serratia proteamaculans]|uniref:LacI family DNA-binding transcriptional regulator n=1 Tax=Serratia proteamaculans TaxID=28151 RepID=UPI00124ACD73|nr:LacI family DNA-binding transcriptional regulator [Serratia proteamaculans]KAB1498166.1 LacI family transcriptional regulator [Serratia proteamaculans]CAI0722064.1 lac repressor [Serratia proteamaculans]CAI0846055.1 lac repressor [Serratia proteamaculans]